MFDFVLSNYIPVYRILNYLNLKLMCFRGLKCIGVENVPAGYLMYEGKQLTRRDSNH